MEDDYAALDVIREEEEERDDDEVRSESGALDREEREEEPFKTNTITVSAYRRSWPQTAGEISERYGTQVKGSRTRFAKRFYRWNALYDDDRPQYDMQRQVIGWQQLPESDVLTGLQRSTLWNGDSGLFDIDVDAAELERIGEMFNPANNNEKRRSARRLKESVLHASRSTAISVLLRRLNLKPPKLAKFGLQLRNMSESYFDESVVNVLLANSTWASADEMQAMKTRLKDGYDLADPDAFLWFLATVVPDTRERLHVLQTRNDFDDWFTSSIRATSVLKSACMEVCTSELLRNMLQITLLIGNRINAAYGGTEAPGVNLKSLSKLSKCKTTVNRSLSVLDCIVSYVERECPELFGVVDDCACVSEASKYSLIEQERSLSKMRERLLWAQTIPEMSSFVKGAWNKYYKIERDMQKTQEAFQKAKRYFGVSDDAQMDTDEFFDALADFFVCLDHSVAQHEERERSMTAQSKNGKTPDRTVESDGSLSIVSKRSGSRRSFFGRPGSSASLVDARKSISLARQSIFGRIKPAKTFIDDCGL